MPGCCSSPRGRGPRIAASALGIAAVAGMLAAVGLSTLDRLARIESSVDASERAMVEHGAAPAPPLTAAISTIVSAAGDGVRCERFELGWIARQLPRRSLEIRVAGTATSRGRFEAFREALDQHRFLGGVRHGLFLPEPGGSAGRFLLDLGGPERTSERGTSVLADGRSS
ncbi:MAG: hypothetical protein FJ257_06910 [Phycisphaerae bacterium]|nr:hypothetical protein [Phycisphaerae bacterium]